MTPQEYNFKHRYKGDTSDSVSFTITQTVSEVTTPIDLTGASIKMQFKKTENATSVIKAFEVGSGITLTDASNGVFTIDSFIVDLPARVYVYDIQITLNGVIRTYLKGKFKVVQDITV